MSAFSLGEFYQRNRRAVIWAILFGLLWLLRDFFGLIFLTFVLAFIAAPLAEFGNQRLHLPQWLSLVLVYLLFLAALASFVRFVAPTAASEVNRLIGNLGGIEERLAETKTRFVEKYPPLREPLAGYLRSALNEDLAAALDRELRAEREKLGLSEAAIDTAAGRAEAGSALAAYYAKQDQLYVHALMTGLFERVRDYAPVVVNMLYRATATILLALLFSFLIQIDLVRLKYGIRGLRSSRLRDFYEEAAQPVVRFGYLVGRAIQAQAVIACINTVLTLIGILVLGVPLAAMLTLIVFVCSFIPVLGVFISTTPIVLVALNAGGFSLSLAVIALVILIHAIEAYVLNPMIYGRHLKLNPVLTLIILFVGYHAFGLWGMLLGVPVARYFIHDVLGVPLREPATARAVRG